MAEDESIALLRQIRDFEREHLELARQTLANQTQALVNQTRAIQMQDNQRRAFRVFVWFVLLLFLLVAVGTVLPFVPHWFGRR
jgi:hypothetical protein